MNSKELKNLESPSSSPSSVISDILTYNNTPPLTSTRSPGDLDKSDASSVYDVLSPPKTSPLKYFSGPISQQYVIGNKEPEKFLPLEPDLSVSPPRPQPASSFTNQSESDSVPLTPVTFPTRGAVFELKTYHSQTSATASSLSGEENTNPVSRADLQAKNVLSGGSSLPRLGLPQTVEQGNLSKSAFSQYFADFVHQESLVNNDQNTSDLQTPYRISSPEDVSDGTTIRPTRMSQETENEPDVQARSLVGEVLGDPSGMQQMDFKSAGHVAGSAVVHQVAEIDSVFQEAPVEELIKDAGVANYMPSTEREKLLKVSEHEAKVEKLQAWLEGVNGDGVAGVNGDGVASGFGKELSATVKSADGNSSDSSMQQITMLVEKALKPKTSSSLEEFELVESIVKEKVSDTQTPSQKTTAVLSPDLGLVRERTSYDLYEGKQHESRSSNQASDSGIHRGSGFGSNSSMDTRSTDVFGGSSQDTTETKKKVERPKSLAHEFAEVFGQDKPQYQKLGRPDSREGGSHASPTTPQRPRDDVFKVNENKSDVTSAREKESVTSEASYASAASDVQAGNTRSQESGEPSSGKSSPKRQSQIPRFQGLGSPVGYKDQRWSSKVSGMLDGVNKRQALSQKVASYLAAPSASGGGSKKDAKKSEGVPVKSGSVGEEKQESRLDPGGKTDPPQRDKQNELVNTDRSKTASEEDGKEEMVTARPPDDNNNAAEVSASANNSSQKDVSDVSDDQDVEKVVDEYKQLLQSTLESYAEQSPGMSSQAPSNKDSSLQASPGYEQETDAVLKQEVKRICAKYNKELPDSGQSSPLAEHSSTVEDSLARRVHRFLDDSDKGTSELVEGTLQSYLYDDPAISMPLPSDLESTGHSSPWPGFGLGSMEARIKGVLGNVSPPIDGSEVGVRTVEQQVKDVLEEDEPTSMQVTSGALSSQEPSASGSISYQMLERDLDEIQSHLESLRGSNSRGSSPHSWESGNKKTSNNYPLQTAATSTFQEEFVHPWVRTNYDEGTPGTVSGKTAVSSDLTEVTDSPLAYKSFDAMDQMNVRLELQLNKVHQQGSPDPGSRGRERVGHDYMHEQLPSTDQPDRVAGAGHSHKSSPREGAESRGSSISSSQALARLRPYKPAGSSSYYYVDGADGGQETQNTSVVNPSETTTVESTHPGSDDAVGPMLPPYAYGSRGDVPQSSGIYGRDNPLGTIKEQHSDAAELSSSISKPSATGKSSQSDKNSLPVHGMERNDSFSKAQDWLNGSWPQGAAATNYAAAPSTEHPHDEIYIDPSYGRYSRNKNVGGESSDKSSSERSKESSGDYVDSYSAKCQVLQSRYKELKIRAEEAMDSLVASASPAKEPTILFATPKRHDPNHKGTDYWGRKVQDNYSTLKQKPAHPPQLPYRQGDDYLGALLPSSKGLDLEDKKPWESLCEPSQSGPPKDEFMPLLEDTSESPSKISDDMFSPFKLKRDKGESQVAASRKQVYTTPNVAKSGAAPVHSTTRDANVYYNVAESGDVNVGKGSAYSRYDERQVGCEPQGQGDGAVTNPWERFRNLQSETRGKSATGSASMEDVQKLIDDQAHYEKTVKQKALRDARKFREGDLSELNTSNNSNPSSAVDPSSFRTDRQGREDREAERSRQSHEREAERSRQGQEREAEHSRHSREREAELSRHSREREAEHSRQGETTEDSTMYNRLPNMSDVGRLHMPENRKYADNRQSLPSQLEATNDTEYTKLPNGRGRDHREVENSQQADKTEESTMHNRLPNMSDVGRLQIPAHMRHPDDRHSYPSRFEPTDITDYTNLPSHLGESARAPGQSATSSSRYPVSSKSSSGRGDPLSTDASRQAQYYDMRYESVRTQQDGRKEVRREHQAVSWREGMGGEQERLEYRSREMMHNDKEDHSIQSQLSEPSQNSMVYLEYAKKNATKLSNGHTTETLRELSTGPIDASDPAMENLSRTTEDSRMNHAGTSEGVGRRSYGTELSEGPVDPDLLPAHSVEHTPEPSDRQYIGSSSEREQQPLSAAVESGSGDYRSARQDEFLPLPEDSAEARRTNGNGHQAVHPSGDTVAHHKGPEESSHQSHGLTTGTVVTSEGHDSMNRNDQSSRHAPANQDDSQTRDVSSTWDSSGQGTFVADKQSPHRMAVPPPRYEEHSRSPGPRYHPDHANADERSRRGHDHHYERSHKDQGRDSLERLHKGQGHDHHYEREYIQRVHDLHERPHREHDRVSHHEKPYRNHDHEPHYERSHRAQGHNPHERLHREHGQDPHERLHKEHNHDPHYERLQREGRDPHHERSHRDQGHVHHERPHGEHHDPHHHEMSHREGRDIAYERSHTEPSRNLHTSIVRGRQSDEYGEVVNSRTVQSFGTSRERDSYLRSTTKLRPQGPPWREQTHESFERRLEAIPPRLSATTSPPQQYRQEHYNLSPVAREVIERTRPLHYQRHVPQRGYVDGSQRGYADGLPTSADVSDLQPDSGGHDDKHPQREGVRFDMSRQGRSEVKHVERRTADDRSSNKDAGYYSEGYRLVSTSDGRSSGVHRNNVQADTHRKASPTAVFHRDKLPADVRRKESPTRVYRTESPTDVCQKESGSDLPRKESKTKVYKKESPTRIYRDESSEVFHRDSSEKVYRKESPTEIHRKESPTRVHRTDSMTDLRRKISPTEFQNGDKSGDIHRKESPTRIYKKESPTRIHRNESPMDIRGRAKSSEVLRKDEHLSRHRDLEQETDLRGELRAGGDTGYAERSKQKPHSHQNITHSTDLMGSRLVASMSREVVNPHQVITELSQLISKDQLKRNLDVIFSQGSHDRRMTMMSNLLQTRDKLVMRQARIEHKVTRLAFGNHPGEVSTPGSSTVGHLSDTSLVTVSDLLSSDEENHISRKERQLASKVVVTRRKARRNVDRSPEWRLSSVEKKWAADINNTTETLEQSREENSRNGKEQSRTRLDESRKEASRKDHTRTSDEDSDEVEIEDRQLHKWLNTVMGHPSGDEGEREGQGKRSRSSDEPRSRKDDSYSRSRTATPDRSVVKKNSVKAESAKPKSWFIPMKDSKPWRKPLWEQKAHAVAMETWPNLDPYTAAQLDKFTNRSANANKANTEGCQYVDYVLNRPNKPMSLQEAFDKKMQRFISRSRQRQRYLILRSDLAHVEKLHDKQRAKLFGSPPKLRPNPDAHPLGDVHYKPTKRFMTKAEMKAQTEKIYKQLPEVRQMTEDRKKNEFSKTNRLRVKMFERKLQCHLLRKKQSKA